MIEYATIADLQRFKGEMLAEERSTLLKSAQERSPEGSIFLSHSSKDSEHISAVVRLLSGHGATVYLDKKDEALPPDTNRKTATILRSRIRQCRKFILFATENSKNSKWMPWELGVSDGYKHSENTAILPAVETATDHAWVEREYLGLYDRIVWGDLQGHSQKLWIVWNQEENTASTLSSWLKS